MSIASANLPTPIYNTAKIPFAHLPLIKDSQGRLMALETIALPGTRFRCIAEKDGSVQVETAEYPSSDPLYVDKRFLIYGDVEGRQKVLPSPNTILQWIQSCKGSRYLWGGNWNQGIPILQDFYPGLDKDEFLQGVDCSGLLYQATNGCTPRNTSQLCSFGEELKIQHLSPEEMVKYLQPLDLMVWRGHVLIVVSPGRFIESRIDQGVVESDFEPRYREAIEKLAGKPFYFRRWHPELPKEEAVRSGQRRLEFGTTIPQSDPCPNSHA
ncbi:MAG TPA: hypothetical protein PKW79_06860 [Rhabdochlamydiaceae bacterium]|nr:hypothetical protein [Rhabdochlamydiaceae bacterium]